MGATSRVTSLYQASIAGTGVRVAIYPSNAAGTTLTCSGKTTGAYKFAAANANALQIVAKNTIGANYKIIGFALDTPSAVGMYRLRTGSGAGSADAASVWLNYAHLEVATDAGGYVPVFFPTDAVALITANGTTDAAIADATSSNVAQDDTVNCTIFIATGLGT